MHAKRSALFENESMLPCLLLNFPIRIWRLRLQSYVDLTAHGQFVTRAFKEIQEQNAVDMHALLAAMGEIENDKVKELWTCIGKLMQVGRVDIMQNDGFGLLQELYTGVSIRVFLCHSDRFSRNGVLQYTLRT